MMIDEIRFVIPGIPHPQGRPRFCRWGKFVRIYESANDTAWKKLVKIIALKIYKGLPLEGPLCLDILFVMPIPKSSKAKSNNWHIKRPDLSNLIKGIEDALNGIIWADDSQICRVTMAKRYGQIPMTDVIVTPLGETK